jgi:hypothetical protein
MITVGPGETLVLRFESITPAQAQEARRRWCERTGTENVVITEAQDMCVQTARLLGKRVEVTLSRKHPPHAVLGKLLRFGAEILCDDGSVRYCWPALHIEEVEGGAANEG